MSSPPPLVSLPEDLRAIADEARAGGRLAVDTEFVWERTYRPTLGVVQVATHRRTAVIDAIGAKDLSPLFPALRDPAVTVVVHGGGQDLDIFAFLMGAPIAGVADTQVMAAFLGHGFQAGLSILLERALGVRLRKDQTYTDWTRRPLRPEQLEYAQADVLHLLPLYDALRGELEKRGRTTWVDEELQTLSDPQRFAPVPPEERYRNVKGWQRHAGQELAVLRALAAWRDRAAERANLRPQFLVSDIVMTSLASRPAKSLDDLRHVRGLSPGTVERHGRALVAAIAEGLACPRESWPSSPARNRRRAPAPGLVALLRASVQTAAEREDIAPEVIATGRDIEALASAGAGAPEIEALAVLAGWRRRLVGERLLAIARGEVAIRYDPATRSVVTEPAGPPRA